MIHSIAFIHTVALLVERFRPRFLRELPNQRCFHRLNEGGLQDLQRDGPSHAITRRIVKIDDAIYAEVARSHGRVGLLCTTRSTLEPSRSLLAEHALASGTRVEIARSTR